MLLHSKKIVEVFHQPTLPVLVTKILSTNQKINECVLDNKIQDIPIPIICFVITLLWQLSFGHTFKPSSISSLLRSVTGTGSKQKTIALMRLIYSLLIYVLSDKYN